MADQTEDRPIVHTFAEYMAICKAEGVSSAEAYRSYRHAYRCALFNRSWDYAYRIRTHDVKSPKHGYKDASYAKDHLAT
jgi:hypothetical protein